MVHQTDDFLRDFIGYRQNQITDLDIEWETQLDRPQPGSRTRPPAETLVLVYRAPDGSLRSKSLTKDELHRYREALLADLQQLGSLVP